METIAILSANLLSPPVIFFAAGIAAVWARSDLKFPDQAYHFMTIYLLLAIGFKGGSSLAQTGLSQLVAPLLATLFIGSLIPLAVYAVVRKGLKYDVPNAAALAAHYGSVSAVTFMACVVFLDRQEVPYEGYLPALMAVMEIPAILIGVFLAKYYGAKNKVSLKHTLHEVLSGKSFALLGCGLVTGLVSSPEARDMLTSSLLTPFYGILTLFLLEMGLTAGEHLREVRKAGWPLVTFALTAPIVQGLTGLVLAWVIGMSQGGSVVFAVLCASASYIAAPAAVRVSIPQANPGYYIISSLGITFPFNLIIGIPLYFAASQRLYSGT